MARSTEWSLYLCSRPSKETLKRLNPLNSFSDLASTLPYPIWSLKDEILNNLDLGVVLNAANEVAVSKFLSGEIGFLDISKISLEAINRFNSLKASNIEDIFEIDKEVRRYFDS